MTAPAVVKHLDVIDDILPGSRSADIPHSKNLLNFETAEEALCENASSQQLPFLLILDSISWFLSSFWKS